MVVIINILFFVTIIGVSLAKANCSCEKFSPLDFSVGSGPILFPEIKVSKIEGLTFDTLENPLSKVYVFLFSKETNSKNKDFSPFDLERKKIISACETKEDGKFCFEKIPKGNYIVCAYTSRFSSFTSKTTCRIINLDFKNKKMKQPLKLPLEVQDL